MKRIKQGIVCIAAGHAYYGKMAAALAATLKQSSPDVLIHLCYSGASLNHLSEGEKNLFSSMSELPEKYFMFKDQVRYIRAKMFMYELSPFDETIFLDVDMAWLKKPVSELFDQLKNIDITFSNHGSENNSSIWVDVEKVKEVYDVKGEKFYGLHSEFVYFKKNAMVRKFFKTAQQVYDKLKVPATSFAGAIPDELPFTIACMLTKIYPHEEKFHPVFWQNAQKRNLSIPEMAKDFYAMSMGGKSNPRMSIENYNLLVQAAYIKLQLQGAYKFKPKNSFLQERSKY